MSTASRTITPKDFGDLMSSLPSGVAVITTQGAHGPMGLTVTSMGPFTAEPPTIMVSVAHSSRSCAPLLQAERFGVHVLHRQQEAVAMAFVRKDDDKFAGLDWSWDDGVPRIDDVRAYLRCRRDATFTHHDHTVVIGEIEAVERHADEAIAPLLYHQRTFCWSLRDDAAAR